MYAVCVLVADGTLMKWKIRPTPIDEASKDFDLLKIAYGKNFLLFYEFNEQQSITTPVEASPIRFASRMGGDRVANPNVTARSHAIAAIKPLEIAVYFKWYSSPCFRTFNDRKYTWAAQMWVVEVAEPYHDYKPLRINFVALIL